MPTFPDLDRFLSEAADEPLVLPIRGRRYTFTAAIPIEAGLRLTRAREEVEKYARALASGEQPDPDLTLLDDASEAVLLRQLIGPDNLAKMEADGITWPEARRVGLTLMAWHLAGPDAALAAWQGQIEAGDARPPVNSSSSSDLRTSPSGSTTTRSHSFGSSRRRRSGGRRSSKCGRS